MTPSVKEEWLQVCSVEQLALSACTCCQAGGEQPVNQHGDRGRGPPPGTLSPMKSPSLRQEHITATEP